MQVSLLPLAMRGGFIPDLLLVVVVVIALEGGARTALWTAAVAGLVVDLAATTVPLGSSVIVHVTVAYLVIAIRPLVSDRSDLGTSLLAGLLCAFGAIQAGLLQGLLSAQDAPPVRLIGWSALIAGAFAILLAPPALAVVRRVLAYRADGLRMDSLV
jgi:rod shape-determining protein MreD